MGRSTSTDRTDVLCGLRSKNVCPPGKQWKESSTVYLFCLFQSSSLNTLPDTAQDQRWCGHGAYQGAFKGDCGIFPAEPGRIHRNGEKGTDLAAVQREHKTEKQAVRSTEAYAGSGKTALPDYMKIKFLASCRMNVIRFWTGSIPKSRKNCQRRL